MRMRDEYSYVRGFNIQTEWGATGTDAWLKFDAQRYKTMIHTGKQKFPNINTVRVWLSFDAYISDKEIYLSAIKTACEIISAEGIKIIPTYFNGWFGLPAFGGFTAECVSKNMYEQYRVYLKDCVNAVKNADILMHDIANEPYNNVYGTDRAFNKVSEFLEEMIRVLRTADGRRITVGSQCCYFNGEKKIRDVTRLAPSVDVISLHPYNQHNKPKDVFEAETVELMDYIETFGKPFLITECCRGAPTEDERLPYLESELETFSKLGVGYIVQGLFTSPVADLHPIEESHMTEGLYMAFLDRNLNVRKHHDIFNKF